MTPTQSKAKCVCGHHKSSHYAHSGEHSGSCGVRFGGYLGGCDCLKFVQRKSKKRQRDNWKRRAIALIGYADHDGDCLTHYGKDCNCGLSKILKECRR